MASPPWDDRDFLGWRDHQAPDRAYLAAEQDGALMAIVTRCGAGLRRGAGLGVEGAG